MKNIPKIIHSIAPLDKSKWHVDWQQCHQSWPQHFKKDFEFKLWNDEEDLENFVGEHYPEYLSFYQELPIKIMKIDVVKLLILHKYGGIFHDMDYICYENFYDEVNNNSNQYKIQTFFVEHRFGTIGEYLQNSLVVSKPENDFLIEVIELSITIFNFYKKTNSMDQLIKDRDPLVLLITGPLLIQFAIGLNKKHFKGIGMLNGMNFNPHPTIKNSETKVITRHLTTGVWFK